MMEKEFSSDDIIFGEDIPKEKFKDEIGLAEIVYELKSINNRLNSIESFLAAFPSKENYIPSAEQLGIKDEEAKTEDIPF